MNKNCWENKTGPWGICGRRCQQTNTHKNKSISFSIEINANYRICQQSEWVGGSGKYLRPVSPGELRNECQFLWPDWALVDGSVDPKVNPFSKIYIYLFFFRYSYIPIRAYIRHVRSPSLERFGGNTNNIYTAKKKAVSKESVMKGNQLR